MATVQVFSVDSDMIGDEYFAGYSFHKNSIPTADKVCEIIIKIAAAVGSALKVAGIEPSSASPSSTPNSWSWLQDVVGVGTAARVGRAMTGADPELCKEYRKQYEAAITKLGQYPASCVPELYASISSPAGDVRTHIDSLSLTDPSEDKIDLPVQGLSITDEL